MAFEDHVARALDSLPAELAKAEWLGHSAR